MGNWQRLLSTIISLISSSYLLYDALPLLITADVLPAPGPTTSCFTPTDAAAAAAGSCSSSGINISFPFFKADDCEDDPSGFAITHCHPSFEHPDWPGFTMEATTDTPHNLSTVMGLHRPPLLPTSSHGENCLPLCKGYINLTWNLDPPSSEQTNTSKCNNLVSLNKISQYIPRSIHLKDFANSAFNFDPSNIILLFGCNATQVKSDVLDSDTAACKSYVGWCKQSFKDICYQYRTENPNKELALPQVMNSSDCKKAMFFVTSNPASPISTWQPALIQLNWNAAGTDWLSTAQKQCVSCLSTNGTCGYGSRDSFRCFCANGRVNTSTNCSDQGITPSPSASGLTALHSSKTLNSSKSLNSSKNLKIVIGVAASLAMALFMSIALLALFCFCKRRKACTKATLPCSTHYTWIKKPSFLSRKQDPFLAQEISYEELVRATDAFAEKNVLGDGGFGAVYKGVLPNGLKVAVKRLHHDNYRRMDHFYNEIKVLSNLNHPNLVKLFSFCACEDKKELLLVYEYASQGTVADHLHSNLKPTLSWSRRLNIACETAATLSYLHNAVNPPIYHRDVKTANILLDDDFHVKLADFGLSKLVPLEATYIMTTPQGTPGYLDPEYHQCYQLTDKSDVYSLGVVLMELISAKLAVDMTRERGEINLSTLAMVKIQCGLTEELVDPNLEMKKDPSVEKSVKRVIELAFACLQACRDDRPSMEAVADVLTDIRREHEEACVKTHMLTPKDANSSPAQRPPSSPPSVFLFSDSSSNLSST